LGWFKETPKPSSNRHFSPAGKIIFAFLLPTAYFSKIERKKKPRLT
jgi:hypothetical protein